MCRHRARAGWGTHFLLHVPLLTEAPAVRQAALARCVHSNIAASTTSDETCAAESIVLEAREEESKGGRRGRKAGEGRWVSRYVRACVCVL
jgi:hypothetical protein